MIATDFNKFVESQQDANATELEWNEIRNEWLTDLSALYAKIVRYLDEYVQAGSISYTFSNVSLTEENLGTYLAPKMNIRIGRQSVSLEPVGTLLVSCKGRVDVIGSAGRALIMLLDERAKSAADLWKVTISIGEKAFVPPRQETIEPISWVWKIVAQTAQKQFVDLDKESFFSLLVEVANG